MNNYYYFYNLNTQILRNGLFPKDKTFLFSTKICFSSFKANITRFSCKNKIYKFYLANVYKINCELLINIY